METAEPVCKLDQSNIDVMCWEEYEGHICMKKKGGVWEKTSI